MSAFPSNANQPDANRKVTSATSHPSGKTIGYVQGNCCGSLDTLVDTAGNRTHWKYDVLGRVTEKWLRHGQPDAVRVQYHWYDNVGRTQATQDARGNQKILGYDAEGRLSQIQYAVTDPNTQPTAAIVLSYEPVYGRLATVLDGTGTTAYSYVPMNPGDSVLGNGALASETKIAGGAVQYTHSYTYDALGRTQSAIRNPQSAITHQWDPLGRLTGMTSGLGAFTYGYEAKSGRLAQVDAALTGAAVAFSTGFTYEGAANGRRLTGIVNQVGFPANDWRVLSQHNYTYDALGRLSTWTKSWRDWATAMQTSAWQITSDDDDQLTGVAESDAGTTPTGSFAYTYDLAGNRIAASRDTPADGVVNRQWTANGLNQLTGQTAPAAEAGALTYDADGNLLSAIRNPQSAIACEWDAENRLVRVRYDNNTRMVEWAYDAFDRRVKQTDTAPNGPPKVRNLLWEGLSIIESRDHDPAQPATITEVRRYYGNGEERMPNPATPADPASTLRLYYTTDHLGSIRELVDATGAIRARYDYDPYGNVTKLSGDLDTDFAYTGHYYHAASGLHLAPYRGYDPRLGRWLSRDPIEEEGGINLYGYARNGPLEWIDQLGAEPLKPYPTIGEARRVRWTPESGQSGWHLSYGGVACESGG